MIGQKAAGKSKDKKSVARRDKNSAKNRGSATTLKKKKKGAVTLPVSSAESTAAVVSTCIETEPTSPLPASREKTVTPKKKTSNPPGTVKKNFKESNRRRKASSHGKGKNEEKEVDCNTKSREDDNDNSSKEPGVSEVFEKFLKTLAAKEWPEVAAEFKVGIRNNTELNRDTRYVISFNVPPDGDFYDANRVDLSQVDNKFIIAAAPPNCITSRENFWRLVYDASIQNIIYLENFNESSPDNFMQWKVGESKDYGKMQVIVKKVTRDDNTIQAMIEVLPEGCSNSLITRIVQVFKWPEEFPVDESDKPNSEARRSAVFAARLFKNERGPTLAVCKNGVGNSAVFVLLYSILSRFSAKKDTTMPELLKCLRHDRWGSLQTEEQYLLVHLLVADYVIAKFAKLRELALATRKKLVALNVKRKG